MEKKITTAIPGKKVQTKFGVYKCPHCGNEHWAVSISEDEKWRCSKCGKVMVEKEENLDKLIIEKEVDGYICPICNSMVEDIPLHYTGEETVDGKMAVLCPECHNFVNGLPLIHHGAHFGDWEPVMSGTDYFYFFHKPCKGKKQRGFCDIYACLIDNSGRVIFNLQCPDCKAVDAVKTHPGEKLQKIERIFLSPNLHQRIGEHPWDNV